MPCLLLRFGFFFLELMITQVRDGEIRPPSFNVYTQMFDIGQIPIPEIISTYLLTFCILISHICVSRKLSKNCFATGRLSVPSSVTILSQYCSSRIVKYMRPDNGVERGLKASFLFYFFSYFICYFWSLSSKCSETRNHSESSVTHDR